MLCPVDEFSLSSHSKVVFEWYTKKNGISCYLLVVYMMWWKITISNRSIIYKWTNFLCKTFPVFGKWETKDLIRVWKMQICRAESWRSRCVHVLKENRVVENRLKTGGWKQGAENRAIFLTAKKPLSMFINVYLRTGPCSIRKNSENLTTSQRSIAHQRVICEQTSRSPQRIGDNPPIILCQWRCWKTDAPWDDFGDGQLRSCSCSRWNLGNSWPSCFFGCRKSYQTWLAGKSTI